MSKESCENCGKPVFFNHHMWSSGPDGGRTTHGPGPRACEDAAAALERMPTALDAAIQALVEAGEAAGHLVFQGDDDEFADVERLQKALVGAYGVAADGIGQVSTALRGAA